MWLINSSIGRKVVMSVTGIALILFLTFHGCMNLVALFSEEGYNMICEFLGANWYAVVATAGLAFLAVCHIVYAFILTAQNRSARGTSRYEVSTQVNPGKVEWASKNMLVLGLVICIGLLVHLWNFWYNMMFAEIVGAMPAISPTDGFEWIKVTFSNPVFVAIYIVWLLAIWFHLTHGFWSAMQTLGLNGKTWFCRWKVIGITYVTVLMLAFLVVVLGFFFECAPSLCQENCCKAQTECVMQAPCEKAQAGCCEEQKAEGCDAEKACKCEECKCDPCQCAEKEGCKCEECKCEDCKC